MFLNQGGRQFVLDQGNRLRLPIDTRSEAVALLDVDRDGDLDALVAMYSGQDLLFENDGTGHFSDVTATRMAPASLPSVALRAVDLDRDGWEDVVVAGGGYTNGPNAIYWNDAGVLRDAGLGVSPLPSSQIDVGDLDGDGNLDIVFGNEFARLEIHWGLGNRGFMEDTTMLPPAALDRWLTAARLVDFDHDGDLDLLQSWFRADCLLENLGLEQALS